MNVRVTTVLAFLCANLTFAEEHVSAPTPALESEVGVGTPEKATAPATPKAKESLSGSVVAAEAIVAVTRPPVLPISAGHQPTGVHSPDGKPTSKEELLSLLRIGQAKYDQEDLASAELAYRQVLTERATAEQDRDALIGLARTYRKKGDYTKASAIYEKLIKEYPTDGVVPTLYLELGRTLRALGANKQAISRFYSVINTTLKLPEQGAEQYRQLTRTAQFEIAETYFQAGDFDQANRFFSRLKLLDLAPEDRARAHFKSVYAISLTGENEKAVVGLKSFLQLYPDDENVPEARYVLSICLRKLGRVDESLSAALELLRAEQARTKNDPKRWAYWQRKTGNQLANEFYEKGDFGSALLIYQSLATLSPELSWRLPIAYQLGLCNERLQMTDRARECYQTIIDNVKSSATDGAPRPELSDLAGMATWRLNHLAWKETTDKQISLLFAAEHRTATVAQLSNDAHRSAANAP